MATESHELRLNVAMQGVDRSIADLQRLNTALETSGRGGLPGTGPLASGASPEDLSPLYQKNADAAAAFNRGTSEGTTRSVQQQTAQYRRLQAEINKTSLDLERLNQFGKFSGQDFTKVAATPTADLAKENALLRDRIGGQYALARTTNAAGVAGYSGLVNGNVVTDQAATRSAAANKLVAVEQERLASRASVLGAEYTGLTAAIRRDAAAVAEAERATKAEAEARLNAAAVEREAAATARQARVAALTAPATATSASLPNPFRATTPAEGTTILPRVDPKSGQVTGTQKLLGLEQDLTAATQLELTAAERRAIAGQQREKISRSIAVVEQEALSILEREVAGGAVNANPAQIKSAYQRALINSTATLNAQSASGVTATAPQTASALKRHVASIVADTEAYLADAAAHREAAAAARGHLTQSGIAALQAPYTPTAAAGGTVPPGPGGFRGAVSGFGDDFSAGFRGRGELPYATQIGQVAKFSVFYGAAYNALFAISTAMKTAVDEAVQYNSALVDLSIATSSSKEAVGGLADSLGRTASAYGLSPSAGVEIGTKAVGIFDLQQASLPQQEFETTNFTSAVSQLHYVTGRDVIQITEDVGAISQAFGIAASDASRVQDLDAFFARRYGSDLGGTVQSVAQVGSIANSAGFSLEETTALASKLQSRTGQTPEAVAGLLSQFLGRSGDPALSEKFLQLGVDITQPFKEQIKELSKLDLSESQRLFIENAFGRGRSGQAASIIIQDFPEIQAGARAAEKEAAGLGAKQTEERLNTVGGALTKLAGNLQQLAVDFGNSGLLDILFVAVKGFDTLVVSIDNFLALWDLLPHSIRDLLIGFAALAVAAKFAAGTQFVQGIVKPGAGLAGVLEGYGARGVASATVPAAEAATGGILTRLGASSSAAITGLTGMSLAASLTTGGLALLAVGAAEAAIQYRNHTKAVQESTGAYTGLKTASTSASTSADFKSGAESLRTSATDVDKAQGFILNTVTLGATEREADAITIRLRADAAYYDEASKYAKSQEKIAASMADVSVFGDPAVLTVDALGKGLTSLQAQGANNVTQFRLLADAINASGDAAGKKAADLLYDPRLTGDKFAAAFQSGIGAIPDQSEIVDGKVVNTGFNAYETRYVDSAREQPGEIGYDEHQARIDVYGTESRLAQLPISGDLVRGQLEAQLEALGLDAEGLSTAYQKAFKKKPPSKKETIAFTKDLIDQTDFTGIDNVDEVKAFALQAVKEQMSGFLKKNDPNRQISQGELLQIFEGTSTFTGLIAQGQSALSTLTEQGLGEGTSQYNDQLRLNLQTLRAQASQAEGPQSQRITDEIRTASDAVVSGVIARMEDLRAVAQASAESGADFRRIGRQSLRGQLLQKGGGGLRTRNIAIIQGVISRASDSVVENIRNAVLTDIAAAEATLAAARKAITYVEIGRRLVRTADAAAYAAVRAAAKSLNKLNAELDGFDQAAKTTVASRSALTPPSDLTDTPADGPTAAQIAASRALAEAARRGDDVSQATAQLQSARADLAAAEAGTVEYYQALAQVYEAERALADAVRAVDAAKALAIAARGGGDIAQATAVLRNARADLAAAPDDSAEYYQALAALYEAQRALAEAIRADKVNQFLLQNDATDPVVQAEAELRRARSQLRYDTNNDASPEVIRSDRLSLEQQQAAKESAKFQQWFSDLQTAESLEKISHAAYIRHLERRSDRLSDIKHRTRQEQEELDQVDQALKAAKESVSGQFNIGDIRVPTPYEVRRFIEQTAANARSNAVQQATGGAVGATTSNQAPSGTKVENNITIDGADTGQVIRILRDILGNNAIRSTATATGKR